MQKTILIIAAVSTLMLTSCKVNKKQVTTTKLTTVSEDDKVVGTYKANVPGANSDIHIELILNADKTFIINSVYVDKNNKVFTENGKYKIENNRIELVDYEGAQYFTIEKGYLKQLDINGKEIETNFPEKYKYTKQIEIPFIEAKNYFVKNYVEKLDNPKIVTTEKFNEIFGMATKMGNDGTPTEIDFNRQYVIAVILPLTDLMTTIAPVSLQKDEKGKITLTYKKVVGQKQTFTIRPTFQIIVDKSKNGKIEIKEQK